MHACMPVYVIDIHIPWQECGHPEDSLYNLVSTFWPMSSVFKLRSLKPFCSPNVPPLSFSFF